MRYSWPFFSSCSPCHTLSLSLCSQHNTPTPCSWHGERKAEMMRRAGRKIVAKEEGKGQERKGGKEEPLVNSSRKSD